MKTALNAFSLQKNVQSHCISCTILYHIPMYLPYLFYGYNSPEIQSPYCKADLEVRASTIHQQGDSPFLFPTVSSKSHPAGALSSSPPDKIKRLRRVSLPLQRESWCFILCRELPIDGLPFLKHYSLYTARMLFFTFSFTYEKILADAEGKLYKRGCLTFRTAPFVYGIALHPTTHLTLRGCLLP